MKFRNTLILFGVVLILFAFVYVFEIRKPEEPTGKSNNLGKMLLVEDVEHAASLFIRDVNRVELSYADPSYQKIVCFKDDNAQWQIEQPLRAKADQKRMNRLISDVMSKNIQNTLKDPEELAEYGLANPRVAATFHLRDGTFRTLLLGNTVPTGNYVYVKQESLPDISLVPASAADDLTKFVSDLRDRTVIALKQSDVQKIRLRYVSRVGASRRQALQIIVCEKEGFKWKLVEPTTAKADTDAVEKIISDVKDLRIERFVAEAPDDLSVYGLSQPQIEVIMSLDKDRTLLIGRKEGSLVYAKTGSDDPVFMVNAEIIDKLRKQPADLRDRTITAFDRKAVEKLELEYPEHSIIIEKRADESQPEAGEKVWGITEPIKAKADESQIDEVLQRLHELKVARFVSDEGQPAAVEHAASLFKYGLTEPRIRVIIFSSGSEPNTLLVGKEAGELVYVKTASVASVYLVDTGIVDKLSKTALNLRDRQMMEFKSDDVKRIQMKRKDKTIVCIKQERDWRIVEPIREKAKNYEINDILIKLGDLRAEAFVVEKAAQLSEYGLHQPDVEVMVTFKDDGTETLLVGNNIPDSGSAYAKNLDEDVIFVIEKDAVDELKKDLDEMVLDAGY